MAIRYVDIPPEDGKAPKTSKPGPTRVVAAAPPLPAEAVPDATSPAAGKAKRKRK